MTSWTDQSNPQPRHFHAQLRNAGGLVVAVSEPITVPVNPFPFEVSLEATPSPVTVPNSIQLTATSNRSMITSGDYRLYVVDDDRDQDVGGGCNGGTTCQWTAMTSWADQSNPQPRHFHAEIRNGAGHVAAVSEQVTVPVQPFPFEVSLTAAQSPVTVPDPIRLTATSNRSMTSSGDYRLYFVDDDTGQDFGSCNSGTTCQGVKGTSWAENPNPPARHFRAEIRNGAGHVAASTDTLTVPVRRRLFAVNLAFSTVTDTSGNTVHKATATTDYNVSGSGYRIKIKRTDGSDVCATSNGTKCGPSTVTVGQTYRGVVEDSQGRNFGQSAAWTLTDDGPQSATVGDLDLAALATAAGGVDICTRLGLSPLPKTNVVGPNTSGGDHWEACAAAAAAGATALAIMLAVADTPGGEAHLWWLKGDLAKEAPSAESEPDPDDATAPRPVPPPFLPDVYRLAQTLTQNQELPQPLADDVANQCLFLNWRAGLSGADCGLLPIFASGNDVPEATVHDLEALAYSFRLAPLNVQWVRLNYRHQDLTPGNRHWMNEEDECQERVPGVTSCDEYPFWATMQGGPESVPQPHLELIDFIDNRDQGLRYGNFIQSCHMDTGDPFLGIPLPPALGIPTQTKICNGH